MLRKEDVYIPLQGKSKEELTELYNFLNSIGENQYRKTLNDFLDNCSEWIAYEFSRDSWILSYDNNSLSEKTKVTIEQLKKILQPMELSLTEQLEKAKAEVERLQKAIEEENRPNIWDWVYCKTNDCIFKYQFGRLEDDLTKITDQELIDKLNELIK